MSTEAERRDLFGALERSLGAVQSPRPTSARRAACPLRQRCTTSTSEPSVSIHRKEAVLQRHKAAQADPAWAEEYRSTRPKVERKIAHFVRVAWGGRKARTCGQRRVATDVDPEPLRSTGPAWPPSACAT